MAGPLDLVIGDFGTVVRRHLVDQNDDNVDVSGATTQQFKLLAPSGAVKTVTTGFTNSGKDGKVQYTLADGDIDETGAWRLQVVIVTGSFAQRTKIADWAQVHEKAE